MAKDRSSEDSIPLTRTEFTELITNIELLQSQLADARQELAECKIRLTSLEGDYVGPGCFKVSDLINNMTPSNLYVTALQGAIAGFVSSNPNMILSTRRQTFVPQILQFAADIVETANRSWERKPEQIPGA